MHTISLITALKLLRFNHSEPEIRDILQATLDELERHEKVRAYIADIAQAARAGMIDIAAIEAVEKLLEA